VRSCELALGYPHSRRLVSPKDRDLLLQHLPFRTVYPLLGIINAGTSFVLEAARENII
jgi:hypothetical protein